MKEFSMRLYLALYFVILPLMFVKGVSVKFLIEIFVFLSEQQQNKNNFQQKLFNFLFYSSHIQKLGCLEFEFIL